MSAVEIKKILAIALFAVVTLPLSAYATGDGDAALAEAELGHYAKALALYETAAEQGDRAAQRIAGLMLYYGERLYGDEIHRDVPAAKRYLAMAAAQGCEVSKFMLARITSRSTASPA